MPTVQVYDVKFDTTDNGFGDLSPGETLELEREIEGRIFKIDCHPDADILEFEHHICDEIMSATGWCVNTFSYRHIVV